ncbi:MAG: substrate-binding domain-containing protein [Oscillospiraceae bacterium]|nr:substrate-binding domain-containing protein [Oscillospiraceae bacterium]
MAKGCGIGCGIIALIILVLIVVSNISSNIEQRKINEIKQEMLTPGVNQLIDLRTYEPFKQGSKAVWLEEESTLKLTENLPRLDGATALYPVYAAFVQAVYPERGYFGNNDCIVQNTTTGKAYERLLSGETDIIFVAGASDEHMSENLIFTPIGKEAFVFFVNFNNPVNSLTTAQIRAIYSGEITNWQEIDGEDVEIMPYQREVNSGSQTAMEGFMGNTPLMKPPREEMVEYQMRAMIFQVEARTHKNFPNAIGYSFLFFATEMAGSEQIKLLEIDGVAPTRENVANGTYPHADYFYAVTVAGNENPSIEPFIEWILGEQGQYLIEKTGYTRVN